MHENSRSNIFLFARKTETVFNLSSSWIVYCCDILPKMGATASMTSRISAFSTKRITKDQILKEILDLIDFDKLCDKNDKTISLQELQNALELKTDVFLTHNWGEGLINHQKVALINDGLKKRGLITWFDEERMTGMVKKKMCEGIDHTRCVAVFVTALYESKVTGNNPNDNCQLEFGYATNKKTSANMVPVVMESEMWNSRQWKGELGMILGDSLYTNMSDMTNAEAKIDELFTAIMSKLGGMSLVQLYEKQLNSLFDGELSTFPSVTVVAEVEVDALTSSIDDHDAVLKVMWVSFFSNQLKFNQKIATKYAETLVNDNVGTMDRLQRKLARNDKYLVDVGFDEDDAEEVVVVLNGGGTSNLVQLSQPQTTVSTNFPTGNCVATWNGHTNTVMCVCQLADGRVVSGSADNTLRVWDAEGKCVATWQGHTSYVMCVCQLADGRVVSGSRDNTLRVWNCLSL